ncbi:hypothetical protein K8Q94_01845 [Candidatus Nomurabacteria bacterium]|nr:hypothetical protein [Candidatus Nomurabacteria bacterium]
MNTIWYTWGDVFNSSLVDLWFGFVQFAPKLILAVVLFIIGWLVGNLVAKAFEHVFGLLKVDKLLESAGFGDFFKKAGMNLNSGYFIGQVVKWFIIVLFLLPSLKLVGGLDTVSVFLTQGVLMFLPRVIIAAFILIIATIVADALSKFITAGSKAMNLRSANMLGVIAKYAVWTFAFIIALGQLGVADTYMSILFTGIIGMLAVGGALALGLGAKDSVSEFLSNLKQDMSHK